MGAYLSTEAARTKTGCRFQNCTQFAATTTIGLRHVEGDEVFLRWKIRKLPKLTNRWHGPYNRKSESLLYSAVVVESERVNGKPRQRIVRYLASIQEDEIRWRRPGVIVTFWQAVDRGLVDLLNLGASESDVDRFRQQIVQRVSPPAAEEVRQDREIMEMFFGNERD